MNDIEEEPETPKEIIIIGFDLLLTSLDRIHKDLLLIQKTISRK